MNSKSNSDIVTMSSTEFAEIKKNAELGKQYVDEIKQEIKRLAGLTGQESLAGFFIESVSAVPKLVQFRQELEKKWDALCPPKGRVSPPPVTFAQAEEGNPIYEKLGVTAEAVEKHRER